MFKLVQFGIWMKFPCEEMIFLKYRCETTMRSPEDILILYGPLNIVNLPTFQCWYHWDISLNNAHFKIYFLPLLKAPFLRKALLYFGRGIVLKFVAYVIIFVVKVKSQLSSSKQDYTNLWLASVLFI